MASQKKSTRWLLYIVGATAFLLVLWPLYTARESLPVASEENSASTENPEYLEAVRNETLGVEKVFAINLRSRPDKQDAIILGSSLSGFQVDFIDGVTPDQVDPKSYPYKWNYDHKVTEYAARRAHVNAIQRVVKDRLGSAIIMEDDSDWDVGIKVQLQSFAMAVRAIQGTSDRTTASPYGDDWDIHWLGHCGMDCKTGLPYFLAPNDPTILPPAHFLPYWRDPPPIGRSDDARLTCIARDAVCSTFYMVSYRGAQRILAALSANPVGVADRVDLGAQFDVSLGRMCGDGYLRCFGVYPALMGGYRLGGSPSKGSDINQGGGEPGDNGVVPVSFGVKYSTLLNINRLLNGEETVHATWDDLPVPDIKPDDIPAVGGILQVPVLEA
ncbi:hypothetical protein FE257_008887 [Aspergillus nanangensis]|uniref:LPS glycosyltransferase n=1 Tax=Aspergillus nanangensis TaxID=2582783 RepID=A0AAD4CWQ1_ASPNN|nr:hypothetical protein FE257_008887 [Aspergillus nanangensis]